eukprot:jgi/Ulvmu1/758/UM010_0132.1
MSNMIVSPEGISYSQEAILGTGAFGTVLKCKHGKSFELDCVIKRVKLARQTPQERFASVQELAVLQQLRHRNLVRGIDGWIESNHTACLVMDFCGGGDLASLLHSRKGEALLEDDVCMILVQLASAIAYLHANGIIHRDLKSSNVFLDHNGLLKLGDLGMCRHLERPTERPKTTAGTLNYMSPELTREQSYSKPTDIWGLGCLMFEVCALRPAFQGFNSQALIRKIRSGRAPLVPKQYSEQLRDLLRSMLFQDEHRRPTAAQVLASPCLQEACAKVEASFGGCHGGEACGPMYLLAAVDPPLLALMAQFRHESGCQLQMPDCIAIQDNGSPAQADGASVQATTATHQPCRGAGSTAGASDGVEISERSHEPGVAVIASSAGRLEATGGGDGIWSDRAGAFGGQGAGRKSGQAVSSKMQAQRNAAHRQDPCSLRSDRAAAGQAAAHSRVGSSIPGSATRLRAAARKARTKAGHRV